jgi:hypothetical protein
VTPPLGQFFIIVLPNCVDSVEKSKEQDMGDKGKKDKRKREAQKPKKDKPKVSKKDKPSNK